MPKVAEKKLHSTTDKCHWIIAYIGKKLLRKKSIVTDVTRVFEKIRQEELNHKFNIVLLKILHEDTMPSFRSIKTSALQGNILDNVLCHYILLTYQPEDIFTSIYAEYIVIIVATKTQYEATFIL